MGNFSSSLAELLVKFFRENPPIRKLVLIVSTTTITITMIVVLFRNALFSPQTVTNILPLLAMFIVGFIFLLAPAIVSLVPARSDSAEAYNERIAEAESKVEAEPEKVRPAWDLARITLEAYFNRNLNQISAIFWLSVVVMIVGFAILVWGIAGAFQSKVTIITAILATTAGIITEFIGATFLFLYRSTIQQGMSYSRTLERINAVGMAMQILDTMPNETKKDDLKSKTKAVLVELLVRQANEASRLSVDTEKDNLKT